MSEEAERIDWGPDAPRALDNLRLAAYGLVVLGVVVGAFLSLGAGIVLLVAAAGYGATVALMRRSARVGRPAAAERLLDGLLLEGDETVLDAGCGRGLLAVGAARRLPRGRAVGIDTWAEDPQAGAAAAENARIAGVAGRVELLLADVRDLPFADASFDAVLSSMTLSRLASRADRERACLELARVLRPGGRLALLDVRATREVAEALEALTDLEGVERSPRSWTTYPPSRLITARRPAGAAPQSPSSRA